MENILKFSGCLWCASCLGNKCVDNAGQLGYSITQSSYTLDTWGLPSYSYYLSVYHHGIWTFPQIRSMKVSCQVWQITDMGYAVVLFQCLSNWYHYNKCSDFRTFFKNMNYALPLYQINPHQIHREIISTDGDQKATYELIKTYI